MGFDAEWLALREPADTEARDRMMLARAIAYAEAGATLLDLGCGTGATARAFETAGAADIRWCFFDNDPKLLARAAALHPKAEICRGDLNAIDDLPLEGVRLVTASALFDLVSQEWLARLATRLARDGIALYAALSYDGGMCWTPEDPLDATVTAQFNAHQCRDKGFGPALGPTAGRCASELFSAKGYDVSLTQSPWKIGPDARALQAMLLEGIAQAAFDMGCVEAPDWATRRSTAVGQGQTEIGHVDFLALPPQHHSN